MHALVLGLLLFGADVGIHVEVREGVSLEESLAIAEALSAAISGEVGWPCRIATPEWVSCASGGDRAACIREVRAATHTEHVLMLKMFGTSTRVRVVAERFYLSDAAIASAELDLRRGEPASVAAAAAARALFPGIQRSGDPKDSLSEGTGSPAVRTSWVPWAVFGASAALAGAGAVFGIEGASGKRELERSAFVGEEYVDRKRSLDTQTTAANVLFTGALVGGAIGLVLFLAGA